MSWRDYLSAGALGSIAIGLGDVVLTGGDVIVSTLMSYPELFLGGLLQLQSVEAAIPSITIPFIDTVAPIVTVALAALTMLKIARLGYKHYAQ